MNKWFYYGQVLAGLVLALLLVSCGQPTPAPTIAPTTISKASPQVTAPPREPATPKPKVEAKATPKPQPATEAPYYQGKTIEILVESAAGGGTDTLARIIAANLVNHIPGNPRIIVRNQPGAQGAVANNAFFNKAKPDGLNLMMNSSGAVSLQLAREPVVQFDLTKYRHIGNVVRGSNVLMVRKGLKGQLTDATARPLVVPAREGSEVWQWLLIYGKEFLGWNVRWLTGFGGTAEMELAFRRGEVDLLATSNGFVVRRMIQEGIAEYVCVGGSRQKGAFKRRTDFPEVPTFEEILGDKKPTGIAWQAFMGWNGPGLYDKALAAPPGTPDKVMAILTDAFARVSKDPKFDEVVKKTVSEVYDVGIGEEVDSLTKEILGTTPEALNYGRELATRLGLLSK